MITGGALLSGVPGAGSPEAGAAADPPMIGIQAGAVSFVDEGTERVLDTFQEAAAINTIFLAPSPMAAASPGGSWPVSPRPRRAPSALGTGRAHRGY
jgi:hypothetical protein